jgi:hypothetical protein
VKLFFNMLIDVGWTYARARMCYLDCSLGSAALRFPKVLPTSLQESVRPLPAGD